MKNCDELELRPELAMESSPLAVCRPALPPKLSSANLLPKIDSPPRPSPRVMSPPCKICPGTILWMGDPLKHSGGPPKACDAPFSPVHRQRKFSQVLGTTSAHNSISMRGAARQPSSAPLPSAQLRRSQTRGL